MARVDRFRAQGARRRASALLLECMIDTRAVPARTCRISPNTAYLNTIPPARSPSIPAIARSSGGSRPYIRWNAMAMVVQANRQSSEYGGHIASYASSATLYEVGFNHFWRAPTAKHGAISCYFQGHASPGIYARAYLEGRLSEENLEHFRQEVAGPGTVVVSASVADAGVLAVPDGVDGPRPDDGDLSGALHALSRAPRHLAGAGSQGLGFLGDGETDEPESMGAITMPVREQLDNLVFVINCNLQRLDGPVRGNGKIIQELEAAFRGAGWNVIKVSGARAGIRCSRATSKGLLRKTMEECVDGEYQDFKAKGGAYTREHFFGKYPELRRWSRTMSERTSGA